MNYKLILKWLGRVALLFFSFCGIATIISHTTNPLINVDTETLKVAWVFGILGFLLLILSFTKFFRREVEKDK